MRRNKPEYTDVTPRKLKKMYPTKEWHYRFYAAVRK